MHWKAERELPSMGRQPARLVPHVVERVPITAKNSIFKARPDLRQEMRTLVPSILEIVSGISVNNRLPTATNVGRAMFASEQATQPKLLWVEEAGLIEMNQARAEWPGTGKVSLEDPGIVLVKAVQLGKVVDYFSLTEEGADILAAYEQRKTNTAA